MRTKFETLRRTHRLTSVLACGLALIGLAGSAFADSPGSSPYEIRLLGRTFTPAAGKALDARAADRAFAAQAQAARARGLARVHALVQLADIPGESERGELSRDGLELGGYVPGRAWIAAIPVDQIAKATRRPGIRWIAPWTAADKVHPRLAGLDATGAEGMKAIAPWAVDPRQPGWISLMVLLHDDVDLGRGAALAKLVGGTAGNPIEGLHGLPLWIPAAGLSRLADEEEVLWIEPSPPPMEATNDGIRTQMKVNTVNSSPYDLDGEGVRLFVYDVGSVRATHESFDPGTGTGSRVTVLDDSILNPHSTHVAGTAGGGGSGSPGLRGRGVAPAVDILSAGFSSPADPPLREESGDLEADYATARNVYQADLATNSFGLNTANKYAYECDWEGDYAVSSALIDKIVRGNDPAVVGAMQVVWAAGNERGGLFGRCGANYGTVPVPACAKNPIQVGAINSDGGAMTFFSSWGPCDDGRLKPTVVAPGDETGRVTNEGFIYSATCGDLPIDTGIYCDSDTLYAGEFFYGTSMAAPAVSGTLALLLQDWRQNNGPWPPGYVPRLQPALAKAALIETSRDLGADGPDYRYGYGAVDAQALIDFERAAGELGGPGLKAWGTGTLVQGGTDTYTLTLPSGIAELKASLAWDDLAAMPFAATALVNDLDLELVGPDNTVYHPFRLDPDNPHLPAVATGANHVDNQEQVLVANPQPGLWTVRVKGGAVPQGAQPYGLAYGATPRAFSTTCTESSSGFETQFDLWTLTGSAVRMATPAPGHGSYSVRLGGANHSIAEVTRQVTLPTRQKSTWSFDLYMTTAAAHDFNGFDEFIAEVRSTSGQPLAVLNFHNEGDVEAVWLPERNIDLTPWAGDTVVLAFRAVTDDEDPSSFWIDDVRVTSCPTASAVLTLNAPPQGVQDGHVFESSETSSVGGFAAYNNTPPFGPATFQVGDTNTDQQIKGFVSFDTSGLPDNAVLVSARLVLYRSSIYGTNPFTTHGTCRVDVKTGAFSNNFTLVPGDFQAAATSSSVAVLSNPTVNGSLAYATLNATGLAAIDKTGTTQLRLAFELGDNDDLAGDAVFFTAGEDATASQRPRLEIRYLP